MTIHFFFAKKVNWQFSCLHKIRWVLECIILWMFLHCLSIMHCFSSEHSLQIGLHIHTAFTDKNPFRINMTIINKSKEIQQHNKLFNPMTKPLKFFTQNLKFLEKKAFPTYGNYAGANNLIFVLSKYSFKKLLSS